MAESALHGQRTLPSFAIGPGSDPEMRREECFDDGFEGATIFRPGEAVALIAIADIGHGDAVSLHCRHDLLGLFYNRCRHIQHPPVTYQSRAWGGNKLVTRPEKTAETRDFDRLYGWFERLRCLTA